MKKINTRQMTYKQLLKEIEYYRENDYYILDIMDIFLHDDGNIRIEVTGDEYDQFYPKEYPTLHPSHIENFLIANKEKIDDNALVFAFTKKHPETSQVLYRVIDFEHVSPTKDSIGISGGVTTVVIT